MQGTGGTRSLARALDMTVGPARRGLGDVHGIGARKGLFQALLQRGLEVLLLLDLFGRRPGLRSRHGALLSNDLAAHPTMLDDPSMFKCKTGLGNVHEAHHLY